MRPASTWSVTSGKKGKYCAESLSTTPTCSSSTTIERLVVHFETLLQSIAANPAAAVASLRLMRADDEQQLLYGWNETRTDYPQGVVHELFAQQVERDAA